MKRTILVAGAALMLVSGAAYAEGGCSYGKMAAHKAKTPVMASVDEAEADRLERLKVLEQQASLDAKVEAPVVFN